MTTAHIQLGSIVSALGDWADAVLIYTRTNEAVDGAIEILFTMTQNVYEVFALPVTAAAGIYIALLGWGIVTGTIAMTQREISIRLLKIIVIIALLQLFGSYGAALYDTVWEIPESVADFFARQLSPLLNVLGLVDISSMDGLAAGYSGLCSLFGARAAEAYSESSSTGTMIYLISLAPLVVTMLSIYIAKFVSAVLFLVAPVVFIFSLTLGGVSSNSGTTMLMNWFKAIAVTFFVVILVYIIGTIGIVTAGRLINEILVVDGVSSFANAGLSFLAGLFGGGDGYNYNAYSLPSVAPVVIVSLLTVVMLSQAVSIANGILGISVMNTQQATSFLQIGALNAAR